MTKFHVGTDSMHFTLTNFSHWFHYYYYFCVRVYVCVWVEFNQKSICLVPMLHETSIQNMNFQAPAG